MKRPEIICDSPDLKIDSLFAFVAVGPDGEGIMAAALPMNGVPTMMPLVGADMARIKSLYPLAKEISSITGRPFKVYRFDHKVDITNEIT